jgi:CheY-like chemotaxis protein
MSDITAPKPVVLLVDDEPLVQRLYARAVTAMACEPRFASDIDEAIEMIEAEPPALMMTDLNLGARSGLMLVRTLVDRHRKSFPILLCSGDDTTPMFIEGIQSGVDDFMVKGMPFSSFTARLRFWIDGPFRGLPVHIRTHIVETLERVAPIGPPIARLRAPAILLRDRARETLADLLMQLGDGFGLSEVDRIRFLGVLDRVLRLLSRTNALAHARRPDIMLDVINSLNIPFRARLVFEDLRRLDELALDPTFVHAGDTLGLRVSG